MESDGARAAAGGWEAEGSPALAGGRTAARGGRDEKTGGVVRDSPAGRRADSSVILHKRVSSLPAPGAAAKQAVCMRTRSEARAARG